MKRMRSKLCDLNLWRDFDKLLTEDCNKPNLPVMGFMYARMSIATARTMNLCIRGSRVLASDNPN